VGVYAVLEVRGRVVSIADPSGGSCNAAGDFDRLLPVNDPALPVLARVDPHGDLRISGANIDAVTAEADILLQRAASELERRGLLRLRALATAGQAEPEAVLWFVGD
jgi:hypothetical protein